MFLSSDNGKRVLNFLYSWGASIVILGAMFKLLHLPYANQILFVAMIVESVVFFISAFERPSKEYHWEDVFPVLKSKNPMDRPDFKGTTIRSMINSPENTEENANYTNEANMGRINLDGRGVGSASSDLCIQGGGRLNIAGDLEISEEDTKNLSESVKKLSDAVGQISKMAEQLSGMPQNMEDINSNSRGYVEHMERLNHNISGLNAMYEMQLKSINTQFEAIQHINVGLGRIREMYEGSVADSAVFRNETDKMTRQLAELNQVYGRLLQAMTVNMGYQQPQPQQPVFQQPAYQQPYGYQPQPPYSNNPVK